MFEQATDGATKRIAEALDSRTARIDERLATMDDALNIGLENVNRTIEGKASSLAGRLREAVTQAVADLDDQATRAGESLSMISARYDVSMATLRSTNNLKTDSVRIGQVLNIPATSLAAQQ